MRNPAVSDFKISSPTQGLISKAPPGRLLDYVGVVALGRINARWIVAQG
jgi:hypothetical protein